MSAERAFYLISYAAITAGLLLCNAEPKVLDGFGSEFDLGFKLHIIALITAILLSIGTTLKHSNGWQKVGFIGLTGVMVVAGLLPISARDALVHHLAVPKMWLEMGKMDQISWHEWSYYPYLIQLGFTGLMKAGLVSLTPLYHLTFLIITAGAACAFGESKHRGAGALAALVILSLPICLTLGAVPLVDLGLLLFSTLAALSLSKWLDSPKEWQLLIISGLAFGLAGLTKFNGVLFMGTCGVALLIMLTAKNISLGQKIKCLFYLSITALLTIAPYLIRNFYWTDNPIYPMYKGFFGAATPALTSSLPPLAHRMAAYGEGPLEILLLPIRVFVFGKEGDPRLFDGLLSPILLVGFLALFRGARSSAGEKFISLSTLLYLLIAITSAGARVRYLAPIYAVLAVNGAPLLLSALHSSPIKRMAAASLLLIHTCYGAFGVYTSSVFESLKYLSGAQTAQEYLADRSTEYVVINWINANIPHNEIVYLLYTGNKFYWFDGAVRSGGYYSGDEVARLVKSSKDSESLYRELKIRGIRHLMTNDQRLIAGFKGLLSNEELAVWDSFVEKHLKLSFHHLGLSVWTLN